MTKCSTCGAEIEQRPEKALDGEIQIVWADYDGKQGWVCPETLEAHKPGQFVMAPAQAINLAIFAINTWMHPDASSVEDIDRLERLSDQTIEILTGLREWVIAQGEDLRL